MISAVLTKKRHPMLIWPASKLRAKNATLVPKQTWLIQIHSNFQNCCKTLWCKVSLMRAFSLVPQKTIRAIRTKTTTTSNRARRAMWPKSSTRTWAPPTRRLPAKDREAAAVAAEAATTRMPNPRRRRKRRKSKRRRKRRNPNR